MDCRYVAYEVVANLRGKWLQAATCAAIALLVVLWPVLCCCGFDHHGCDSGSPQDTAEVSGDEEHRTAAADEHHAVSDDRHDGSSGGCHDDSPVEQCPNESCGCQKSKTQLSSVDTAHAFVGPLAVAALQPGMGTGAPTVRSVARWTPRVERPPPRTLTQLRVLRI